MPDLNSKSSQDPLSTLPVSPELKRKPRFFLGTFWLLIAVLLIALGFVGTWWLALLGVALFVYAIYLYRGGRFGFWVF
jgi:cytoskeletal protein RodZ